MKTILVCFVPLFALNLVRADAPSTNVVAPPLSSSPANSLTDANAQAIFDLLTGRTPGIASQARFTGGKISRTDMAANVFVKNPDNWAASVDMTCVSVYNDRPDGYGSKFQTTAISPRHGIGPAHTPAGIGTHYNWLASDGTTVTRTIIGEMNAASDIEIYLFDHDLPSTVTPAKLLPSDWARYLDGQRVPEGCIVRIPVIMPTQEAAVYCNEAALISTTSTPQIFFRIPSTPLNHAFGNDNNGHHGIWSGDSGFTAGMLINGDYVPIVEWHMGGGGSGPFLAAYLTQINAAMHTLSTHAGLSTDYQVTVEDLSRFSTY